jgi:hypothetical protein
VPVYGMDAPSVPTAAAFSAAGPGAVVIHSATTQSRNTSAGEATDENAATWTTDAEPGYC